MNYMRFNNLVKISFAWNLILSVRKGFNKYCMICMQIHIIYYGDWHQEKLFYHGLTDDYVSECTAAKGQSQSHNLTFKN